MLCEKEQILSLRLNKSFFFKLLILFFQLIERHHFCFVEFFRDRWVHRRPLLSVRDRQTSVWQQRASVSLPSILFLHMKKPGYALSSDRVSALWTLSSRRILSWQNLPGYWSLDLLSFCVAAGAPGQRNTWERTPTRKKGCYVTGGCLWLGHARS